MSTDTIRRFERAISDRPQIDIAVDHFFSDGVYGRVMDMPASTALVGATHKHNHLAILLSGTVLVSSKYGKVTYQAPAIVNVFAGDKRAFFAITDVSYMTIHVTDETDLDKLEQELVEC